MAGRHPLSGAMDFWEEVVDDMEATAEEYRDAGWETLELHPGDVTALPTAAAAASDMDIERTGLDVLLPGDEFEELQSAVEGHEFTEYDAYRASENDVVFLVIAMKSTDGELAVLFPLYYAVSEAKVMLSRTAERGEMRTFLRPLDDSERVVFSQQEPDNLLPDGFDPAAVDEDEVGADLPPELEDPLSEDLDDDGDVHVEVEMDDEDVDENDDE
jgi:hypothetical protein